MKLYNLIFKKVGDNQRACYDSGIRTHAGPSSKFKKVLYHKIDSAIAGWVIALLRRWCSNFSS